MSLCWEICIQVFLQFYRLEFYIWKEKQCGKKMGLELTPLRSCMLGQIGFNFRQAVFRICTFENWVNFFPPHLPTHPLPPPKIVEDLLCFDLLIEFDHETSFLYLIQKVVGHAVNMYYSLIHIYKHKHNYGVNGKGYSFLARGLPYTILKNVLLKVEIISCSKKQFPNLSS